MNRDLHIERVYSLGDYKSIRFSDTVSDLPEKVMLDPKVVGGIQTLQLVTMEIGFRRYLQMMKDIPHDPEKELAYLEEVRVSTLDQIKSLLNGNLEK